MISIETLQTVLAHFQAIHNLPRECADDQRTCRKDELGQEQLGWLNGFCAAWESTMENKGLKSLWIINRNEYLFEVACDFDATKLEGCEVFMTEWLARRALYQVETCTDWDGESDTIPCYFNEQGDEYSCNGCNVGRSYGLDLETYISNWEA